MSKDFSTDMTPYIDCATRMWDSEFCNYDRNRLKGELIAYVAHTLRFAAWFEFQKTNSAYVGVQAGVVPAGYKLPPTPPTQAEIEEKAKFERELHIRLTTPIDQRGAA